MYIARVPNRNSPPAILLRESFRKNGKVKTRSMPCSIRTLLQILFQRN